MMVFDVKRPLIPDIAMAAGVSTATVDRVLNRRPGVRKVTLHRVLEAAVKVGYLGEEEVKVRLGPAFSKVVFLLPQGTNPYLTGLNTYVRALAEQSVEPLKVRSHFIESFNPEALVQALRRYGKTSDVVIFMAIEHPKVRQVIDELVNAGKRVVTIISDLPTSNRHAYIGIDNFAAGRTAAKVMGRFCRAPQGKLALVAASRAYRAHMEREMGFLALIEESFPHLTVIGPHEGHDNRDENYNNTRQLLDQHSDLVGIYNVGGSSDGIGRALRESGRADNICFIGHGLTPDTRKMLIEGNMDMVITQNPTAIYTRAIEVASGEKIDSGAVSMEIYFSENLPIVSP
ncbi:LacI family DNA-binding transcriptional regulator [Vreelandella populi]|uniref:LacI family DNA-binding transcriptional regulator n=1 Tax=Vreelandella populi TaxID=2498858 RepID=A0A3S0YJ50_9GAMM|nr:LacI family DNA-binding transcriptional regulator [Halomonas populi]RUR42489.1 LacI family DNA-binding transcriptional regulator [Halomonas populi]RUR45905.1 LacI family DNA-binding transcriptional regulator [Halomonas populi]